ncbi:hypothetical protein AB835_08340 [Candidatus Endobugula sertula]|uniref:Uncharacterized protein n=1 Tax=Candidatus Endobugula sertula TaxID=62101 RepID=A0A1D2QPS2_9GAMM|nr:hypothetical protein AB835_08340 [Candidatus Endobugula sertula]
MTSSEKITAFKDLFSIGAAICVAAWAAYGIWLKNEERIADLKVIELEQKTDLRSHLLSEIIVDELHNDGSSTIFTIDVNLNNIGNDSVRVILDERSLLISKVQFQESKPLYRDVTYIGDYRYRGVSKIVGPFVDVGPKESYRLSYSIKLDSLGTYLIRFLATMESDSVKKNKDKNLGPSQFLNYSTGADKLLIK